MEQAQNFFSKVSTRKERERAFVLLTETNTRIECQFEDKIIVDLIPEKLKDSFMVVTASAKNLKVNQPVILTFNIGQEKYFMKTSLEAHDLSNNYLVNLEPALFKLQRRNSFRVQIPQGYSAKVTINQINQQKVLKKFPLYDLSGGGFAFEIPPENNLEIESQNLIQGDIEVGGKFKKSFTAIIRHCVRVGSAGSGLKKIGAEFTNLSPNEQQEFINVVMEIHRDMFSKFKIGTR